MKYNRRIPVVAALAATIALATACVPPPEPPPDTNLHHLTTWEAEVAYADSGPEVVDWVGYGSYAYNAGLGGCNIVDGGDGFTETFLRLDPATLRVTITLDWIEGENGVDPYGCGVNEFLSVGLRDAGGNEVAFELIPLKSHT